MKMFTILGLVKRFPGKYGWHYIEIDEEIGRDLRVIIKGLWPALLPATFTVGKTTRASSIMPIKDGPLFIALSTKVRKAENIAENQEVRITFKLQV